MIKMCVRFYPKYDVELIWSSLRSGFAYDPDARICIRCGGPLRPRLEENARSRVMNVQICPECGIDEALRDARDDVLPMSEWADEDIGHNVGHVVLLAGEPIDGNIPEGGSREVSSPDQSSVMLSPMGLSAT